MPNEQQRQQRAEARERQPREDRERVDEALVEDAEHEVDHEDRRSASSRPRPVQRRPGTPAPCPGSSSSTVGGQHARAPRPRPAPRASPSETPGVRLNEMVTAGSWPRWLTVSGPTRAPEARHRVERHQLAGAASARRGRRQRVGLALVLGEQLEDDLVLVGRACRWSRPAASRRRGRARPRSGAR